MDKVQEAKLQLNQLLKVLKEEKEALIKNDGHKIIILVEKKSKIIDKLAGMRLNTIATNQELENIVKNIQEVQETNLLLTNQALKFQESLIETVANNIKNVTNVYSDKGGYQNSNQSINIIDQEI